MLRPNRTAAAVLAAAGLTAAGCAQAPSGAQDYPRSTVRIIAPFAAGGISDTTARVASKCLEKDLGGTFIVENKDGGGGAIGMTEVAQAKPDGSTLSVVSASTAALVPLVTDGAKYGGASFDPISGITLAPSVLVVKNDSPHKNAQDLLEAARAKNGGFTVAMPGSRGIFALTTNAIAAAGGPKLTTVPFESNDKSAAAVLGGNADSAYLSTSPSLLEQIRAGKLRALATGAKERVDFLPDVPTFSELGFADLPDSTVNVALVAPRGLDDKIETKIADSMQRCLKDPKTAEVLGKEFVRDDNPGPHVMREELNTSEASWRKAVGR